MRRRNREEMKKHGGSDSPLLQYSVGLRGRRVGGGKEEDKVLQNVLDLKVVV